MTSNKRQLREVKLSKPISDWLRNRGFRVYTEVPLYASAVDIVGACLQTSTVVTVELKVSFTRYLLTQAASTRTRSHESWACTFSKPKQATIDRARIYGIGLLRVVDDKVIVVLPAEHNFIRPVSIEKLMSRLKRMAEGGVGGKPNLKGEGPAQDVARAVKAYIKDNNPANWLEVFENVPNHYAHKQSFQGVMNRVFGITLKTKALS